MPPEALDDAELTSIVFADPDTGWAAGDRGVIWHTIDGGRHWQRQDSSTRSRLECLSFISAELGWAVGGSHQAYTHRGVGVVLRTVDGGRTWESLRGLNLPALKYVKFFGPRQGIAVGESSGLYPGGIFLTGDGGESWSSLPAGSRAGELASRGAGGRVSWIAGDFLDMHAGVVVSAEGAVGQLKGLDLLLGTSPAPSMMRRQAVRTAGTRTAWVCGTGGLVQRTDDGGASWTWASPLPAEAARSFDFTAMAVRGMHCWVAGHPGSVVFRTADGGRTWQAHRTDSAVPISSLFFLDEQRGWAAGALGTILATRDGGQTWRVQRQGAQRAALLAVFSQANRMPQEAIVQQAGSEGYVTALELLSPRPDEPEALVREMASTLLAAHCWSVPQFPLRKSQSNGTLEQITAAWDALHGGQSLSVLEEHLVRRIRTWRPDVILTEDAHPGGGNPLAHISNQLVLSAMQKAADPMAYRRQIEQEGLAQWKVKKLWTTATNGKEGDLKLVCTQLAPRLGASLADVADEARSRIDAAWQPGPATRGFNLLVDHLPQGQGRRDFFSGIALPAGGEARRPLSNPPIPDFARLTSQIQRRQALHDMLERSGQQPLRGSAWLTQASDIAKGLSPTATVRMLHHLALRYHASGESEQAAEIMSALTEKHADHPLSDAAAMWLLHYYASGEAAHRGGANFSGRLEQAAALGKQLEKSRPLLIAEPAVRYAMAAAKAGRPALDEEEAAPSVVPPERLRAMQGLTALPWCKEWSDCAAAELWIAGQGSGTCPKKLVTCKAAAAKPVLDGRLDDAVWQATQVVALRESAGPPLESVVALAHDDEFLYVAISCQRSADFQYETEQRTRGRDGDLSSHDRLEILLDIDRDYATYYTLAVDHRGWTSESCLGDLTWNPTWYVAAGGDEAHWTVEAAIPLAELTAEKLPPHAHWAIGLQRIVPGVGVQHLAAAEDRGEGPQRFGVIRLE